MIKFYLNIMKVDVRTAKEGGGSNKELINIKVGQADINVGTNGNFFFPFNKGQIHQNNNNIMIKFYLNIIMIKSTLSDEYFSRFNFPQLLILYHIANRLICDGSTVFIFKVIQ